jgi:Septum formation
VTAARLRRGRAVILVILAVGACGGGSNAPERDERGTVVVAGRVPIGELAVGDCFDDPAKDTVASILVVPCDEPHQIEVVGLVQLADGDYPGRAGAEYEGRARCDDALQAYVDGAGPPASIALDSFVPTPASWADGDRIVQCLAFRPDKSSMDSTLRGSHR